MKKLFLLFFTVFVLTGLLGFAHSTLAVACDRGACTGFIDSFRWVCQGATANANGTCVELPATTNGGSGIGAPTFGACGANGVCANNRVCYGAQVGLIGARPGNCIDFGGGVNPPPPPPPPPPPAGYAAGCTGVNRTDPDATGLVPCGVGKNANGALKCPCQLGHLFLMVLRVYNFIVIISTAIAGLLVVIGGVIILISGGPSGKNPVTGVISPNLYSRGKDMIIGAAIGIFLIFGAWLIMRIVLTLLGYDAPLQIFF